MGDTLPPRATRAWFARATVTVARALVGARLVVDPGGPDRVIARIVEVEAYLGIADEASHARRGPTPRSAIMFGDPGHLYVYLSYGVHHCANLVTEKDGVAGAVLLRAAAVEEGAAVVRRRRAAAAGRPPAADALLRGPGNLCRGLGIGAADNGSDVCAGDRIAIIPRRSGPPLAQGPRVGISRARDSALRFAWEGHPAVSSPPPAGRDGTSP